MMKKISSLLLTLIVVFQLTGCSFLGDKEEPIDGTLRVLCSSPSYFHEKYGNGFSDRFSQIKLEVLELGDSPLETMKVERADVVLLSMKDYVSLSTEGELLSLDGVWDEEEQKAFSPEIIDLMKEIGEGTLYGLPPVYQHMALFYNKDIFDRVGVEEPVSRMTWKELFDLSRRFPKGSDEDAVIGLSIEKGQTPFDLINLVAQSEGLQYSDPSGKRIELATESWKHVFGNVLEFLRSNPETAARKETNGNPAEFYTHNPFFEGKAAMLLGTSNLIDLLKSRPSSGAESALNWGLVSGPVSETNRNGSPYYEFHEIFSIPKDAEHLEAAKELLRYVNGSEWAKVRSKLSSELLTRTDAANNDTVQEPFTSVPPVYTQQEELSSEFLAIMKNTVNQEIAASLSHPLPLEQLLNELQHKLQQHWSPH